MRTQSDFWGTRFHIDAGTRHYYRTPLGDTYMRRLCTYCIDHEQGEVGDVHDCKNLFVDDAGRVVGQCCCYSAAHGRRQP